MLLLLFFLTLVPAIWNQSLSRSKGVRNCAKVFEANFLTLYKNKIDLTGTYKCCGVFY